MCWVCRPLVKPATDPSKWAPTLKTKIAMSSGEPAALVFDVNKQPATLADVPKGAVVRAIFQVGSVWFVGGKNFGITLKVMQIGLVSVPNTITNTFGFVDEDMNMIEED